MKELEDLDAATAALQAAVAVVTDRRAERNAAIEAAFAAGVSIGAIAERTGLGRTTVQDVLGNPYGRVGRPPAGT